MCEHTEEALGRALVKGGTNDGSDKDSIAEFPLGEATRFGIDKVNKGRVASSMEIG